MDQLIKNYLATYGCDYGEEEGKRMRSMETNWTVKFKINNWRVIWKLLDIFCKELFGLLFGFLLMDQGMEGRDS